MILMVSNQDGVLVDEFGIPIYDENGEINEDQLDDYQRNPEGLQVGDQITVIGKGLRFYHIRKFQVRWRSDDPCAFTTGIPGLFHGAGSMRYYVPTRRSGACGALSWTRKSKPLV